jgi:glycosyltransferase involved in cell wall biosynthesis
MKRSDRIEVELVEHSPGAPLTGIGRYTRELYDRLLPHVSVRLTTHIDPPFATGHLSFLHHLPVGVRAHQAGNIVHFTEDMGCSQMLWSPVRPAVATSHDLGMLVWPPEANMHRPLDRVLVWLSYLGLKRMDAIITISEYSRQTIIQRLGIPAERVFTVYSGNDNQLFRPIPDARAKLAAHYDLPDSSKYRNLLYVGSELPRKNLATLFRVLTLLPKNVRLLKVGVAGGRRFREHTQKLIARFDLGERVLFLEQVPEQDLPLFYGAADVYLCASFLEGFGHPVVEAMACGAPVVCSNNSSLPEVAGDAAILVPPANAEAYAEAVLLVLDDNGRREQMIERGLKRAASFSWDQTAKGVAEVYQLIATNATRGSWYVGQLDRR